MQSMNKLHIIFLGLICTFPVFTMDQHPLEQLPTEAQASSITLSNADSADRKITADKIEQKKKNEETEIDILAEAFCQLKKGKRLPDNELRQMLSTMPDDACYLIGNFAASRAKEKYIAKNMENLIPSIITMPTHITPDPIDRLFTVFIKLQLTKPNLIDYKTGLIAKDKWAFAPNLIFGEDVYGENYTDLNAFIVYKFPGATIFKVCPTKFNTLNNLSMEQLHYLTYLYGIRINNILASSIRERYEQIISSTAILRPQITGNIDPGDIDIYNQAEMIHRTPAQILTHNSLPDAVRSIVESNYKFLD